MHIELTRHVRLRASWTFAAPHRVPLVAPADRYMGRYWPRAMPHTMPKAAPSPMPAGARAASGGSRPRPPQRIEQTTSLRRDELLHVAHAMEARGYSYVGHRTLGTQTVSTYEPAGFTISVLTGSQASSREAKVAAMQQRGWALASNVPTDPFLTKLTFRYRGE